MASQFTYRLQILLDRKEEAKRDAELSLVRKEQELASQMAELESLRMKELNLRERRDQQRRELLKGSGEQVVVSAIEVKRRSDYVKQLGQAIDQARSDAAKQASLVERCHLAVKEATLRVAEARREVEVLTKHRSRQQDRFVREQQAKEDLALDEIGNVLHSTRSYPL
jgi:flagellar biosynthesis chaperone FliJ